MVNETLDRGDAAGWEARRRAGPDVGRGQAQDWRGATGGGARARPQTRRARRDRLLGRLPEGRPPDEQKRRSCARTPRERTRLRSAKLLDGAYRFLCEGRICDRSRDGLRLALARDVTLPPRLAVHIDETSEVREAKVIWRRGSTIGVRLQETLPADAMTASRRSALRERYYAIPD